MYHKQNVNYKLNQDIKKMSSENTTYCQSCIFSYIFTFQKTSWHKNVS